MVEVLNIKKYYGSKKAVDDISFKMEKGKIYGLLGPNGAGKTTTMNIMTGYTVSDSGTVLYDGADIFYDRKEALMSLSYLPEFPPLYPDMTVFEYLCFAGELKGLKKNEIKKEAEDVMEKTKISSEKNKLIKKLSKGFKERVGISQALLNSPSVLILDEPTSGLDPLQIKDFNDLILSIKEDRIILISSHILSEISALCDHVFMISNGKLCFDDDIKKDDTDLLKLFTESVILEDKNEGDL